MLVTYFNLNPKFLPPSLLTLLTVFAIAPHTPAQSTDTSGLVIQPKGSIGYSTSGGGFDGFGAIDGFIPLYQNPSSDLWYTQVRGRFDNDANLSGTALFGYRRYDASSDQVLGGYIGYDGRGTDSSFFNQLGAGIELLGDVEVRLNGYWPVGDRRKLTGSTSTTTTTGSTNGTNATFTGNALLLALGGGTTTTTTASAFEAVVGGVDLEVGTRLLDWNGGHLKGYAGIYYQDPAGAAGVIGGRGRLVAQVARHINTGIAVSSDDLFGTNVTVQMGATFGGAPKGQSKDDTNLAHLGDFVQRQSTLAIDQQTETRAVTTTVPLINVEAINPATGQSWRFVHVTGGAVGGDGTFENPFNQITDGVADAAANSGGAGNDVVYVQAGTNPGLDGFVIPDNVQVLGSAIAQTVATTQQGPVTLPDSNNGVRPLINGAVSGRVDSLGGRDAVVSLGNSSTLSGLEVQGGLNTIGILVQDASAAAIADTVINADSFGIFVDAAVGNANNALITNNTVNSNSFGIFVNAVGDANNALIENNTVNSDLFGVFVKADGGNASNAMIMDNIIDSGTFGIFVQPAGGDISNAVLTNNTITANGFGIYVQPFEDTSNTTISGNTIDANSFGLFIQTNGGDISDTTISNNTIDSNSFGIRINTFNGDVNGAAISDNTITATNDGIAILTLTTNAVCVALSGNTATNTGTFGTGVDFQNLTGNAAQFRVVNLGTLLADNPGITTTNPDPITGGNFEDVGACP